MAQESPQHPPPEIDFVLTGLCLDDSVTFVNYTTGGASDYDWTVSDSNGTVIFTSASKEPRYLFPGRGAYGVKLVAYNGHRDSLTQNVWVDSIAKVDFTILNRCALGESYLLNLSTCTQSYTWKINNIFLSDSSNLRHHFPDSGIYKVTLIAAGYADTDSVSRDIRVFRDFPNPKYHFTVSNDTVQFIPEFPQEIETYLWDLGDGTTSDLPSPKHVYGQSGIVNSYLQASNDCGPAMYSMDVRTGISRANPGKITGNIYWDETAQQVVVTLPGKEPAEIILTDITGKVLQRKGHIVQTQHTLHITAGHLSPGLYVLMVRQNGTWFSRPVIRP